MCIKQHKYDVSDRSSANPDEPEQANSAVTLAPPPEPMYGHVVSIDGGAKLDVYLMPSPPGHRRKTVSSDNGRPGVCRALPPKPQPSRRKVKPVGSADTLIAMWVAEYRKPLASAGRRQDLSRVLEMYRGDSKLPTEAIFERFARISLAPAKAERDLGPHPIARARNTKRSRELNSPRLRGLLDTDDVK